MVLSIPITRGKCTVVDDEDFAIFGGLRWSAVPASQRTEKWYAVKAGGGTTTYLHRAILNAPPGLFVDHIDGDGLNNRRSNLRLCTPRQNSIHRTFPNRTGYRGVYANQKRYRAIIESDGVAHRLGTFDTPAEAARAYDARARELHGEFAVLNFSAQAGAPERTQAEVVKALREAAELARAEGK